MIIKSKVREIYKDDNIIIGAFKWFNHEEYVRAVFDYRDWSVDILAKLKEYNVQDVYIHGFAKKKQKYETLECLEKLSFLRIVVIEDTNDKFENLDSLYNFQNLQSLKILQEVRSKIDVSKFPHLIDLQTKGRGSVIGIEKCYMLKNMVIWSYANPDFNELIKLKKLKSLEIVKGRNLNNLSGCEGLINLEWLSLYQCTNLTDISMLAEAKQLRALHMDCCKKINDYNVIGRFENLEELCLRNCGEIESIRFLEKLPKIKRVIINGDTRIIDNDIAFIFQLPAIYGITIRFYSSYNITFDEYNNHPLTSSGVNPIEVNWEHEIDE